MAKKPSDKAREELGESRTVRTVSAKLSKRNAVSGLFGRARLTVASTPFGYILPLVESISKGRDKWVPSHLSPSPLDEVATSRTNKTHDDRAKKGVPEVGHRKAVDEGSGK